jgi:hypothetical protein
MVVYECTIDSIQSNYITTTIGNIVDLNENQPTSCFYTPYYTYSQTYAILDFISFSIGAHKQY